MPCCQGTIYCNNSKIILNLIKLKLSSQSVVAEISAEDVKGIGFDATCSLVAIDKTGSPVTISLAGIKRKTRYSLS